MSALTPTTTPAPNPERPPLKGMGDERSTTISAGGGHTCGVSADGSDGCWGKLPLWPNHATRGEFASVSVSRTRLVDPAFRGSGEA